MQPGNQVEKRVFVNKPVFVVVDLVENRFLLKVKMVLLIFNQSESSCVKYQAGFIFSTNVLILKSLPLGIKIL